MARPAAALFRSAEFLSENRSFCFRWVQQISGVFVISSGPIHSWCIDSMDTDLIRWYTTWKYVCWVNKASLRVDEKIIHLFFLLWHVYDIMVLNFFRTWATAMMPKRLFYWGTVAKTDVHLSSSFHPAKITVIATCKFVYMKHCARVVTFLV